MFFNNDGFDRHNVHLRMLAILGSDINKGESPMMALTEVVLFVVALLMFMLFFVVFVFFRVFFVIYISKTICETHIVLGTLHL